MSTKTKLITLCMIVKDEIRDLPRCLQSVRGVVDQIVVVDTGSTDGTIDAARQFGAIVVRSAWTGDFAGARNKGLVHAEGEWILFLDADEELDAATRDQLRTLALHREMTGFFLNVWNYSGEGGEGATINPVLRMFRNDRRYRFEGRIHEQIALPIMRHTPDARFHLSDVIIHHYGYRREVVAAKDKMRRNRTLLEQAIAEEPENRFNWYNLGVEYFRAGEVEEALTAFRRARDGIDYASISYAHLLVKHETSCLQVLRRWQEALLTAEEGLGWYGEYPDLWHAKGVSLAALGRRRQAAEAFAAAIAIGRAPALYHTEDGMGTYQSAYWLGTMYEAEQEWETAAHWYAEAVRYRGSLLAPLYRLCRMMKTVATPERLAEFARTRFKLESPQAAEKLAGILLDCGCYEALGLSLGKWSDGAGDGVGAHMQPWLDLADACLRWTAEKPEDRLAEGRCRWPADEGGAALQQGARALEQGSEALPDLAGDERTVHSWVGAGSSTAEPRIAAMRRIEDWLQAEEEEACPPEALEWLPLLLSSEGTGGAAYKKRIRNAVGALLDGRPSEEAAAIGQVREGVRAGALALCVLVDRHLAAVQQASLHTQAVQTIRLALPYSGKG